MLSYIIVIDYVLDDPDVVPVGGRPLALLFGYLSDVTSVDKAAHKKFVKDLAEDFEGRCAYRCVLTAMDEASGLLGEERPQHPGEDQEPFQM